MAKKSLTKSNTVMRLANIPIRSVGFASLFLLVTACSRLPKGPERPDFDPAGSARQALDQYDTNKDGSIDDKEAQKAPGILSAFTRIDVDQNQALDENEIATRIRYYKSASTIVAGGNIRVKFRGAPLAGATITLEPESFLGKAFQTCTGVTGSGGVATLSGTTESKFPGIYLGLYRMRVSLVHNGKEMIPAKYNTETTLGYEAADDLPTVFDIPTFNLSR